MNRKQILLSLVLVDFVAFTAWAVYSLGLREAFGTVLYNASTVQMILDLVIALSVGAWLMVADAKKRGINPWPYVALTACTGSPGLLVYLIKRVGDPAPESAPAATPQMA